MRGIIKIEDYKIHCTLGVHPHERIRDQEIAIDLSLEVDFTGCVNSDSLKDTVDYEEVVAVCSNLAHHKKYHLIETFAFDALEALFAQFPLISAKIRVKKKGALPLASFVAVELEKR